MRLLDRFTCWLHGHRWGYSNVFPTRKCLRCEKGQRMVVNRGLRQWRDV